MTYQMGIKLQVFVDEISLWQYELSFSLNKKGVQKCAQQIDVFDVHIFNIIFFLSFIRHSIHWLIERLFDVILYRYHILSDLFVLWVMIKILKCIILQQVGGLVISFLFLVHFFSNNQLSWSKRQKISIKKQKNTPTSCYKYIL